MSDAKHEKKNIGEQSGNNTVNFRCISHGTRVFAIRVFGKYEGKGREVRTGNLDEKFGGVV